MRAKIKLAIFTARNLRTSTASTDTVLNIVNNLDPVKYSISLVLIDKLVPNYMRITASASEHDAAFKSFALLHRHPAISALYNLSELRIADFRTLFQVAIVAIYNDFGEDGRLLGLLDTVGIPYVSPGLMTSALCFDKSITKSILRAHGIAVPKGFDVELASYQPKAAIEMMAKKLGYPLIIKPASSGASRGVVLVTQPEDLWRAIRTAGKFSDRILIEERLDGQEFSVGVVGDFNNVSALPVVEIRTRRPFFDYRAKYVPGESEELCPAPIGGRLKRNLQRAAIRAFQAVRGQSHSRIDMVFTKRKIFVLEINTFPGLTRGSIFPKELQALGSSLGEFLDRAISLSLSRTTRANRSHIL